MSKDNINWSDNSVMKSNPSHRLSPNSMQRNNTDPSQNQNQNQTLSEQGPPPVSDKNYIAGYLARNIGKNVRAEFVVGTNQFVDKTGILREVGVNYFVLEDYISHARIMCDLYSVKFVTTL